MLKWKKIKKEWPHGKDIWHSAKISAQVDVSAYVGEWQVWGGKTASVCITFSIHPRRGRDCHSECFPYQLLVNGGQSHVYLTTIVQGKKIAENIAKRLLFALMEE